MTSSQNSERDEILQELGRRTADISHEIRNFLTPILAGAQLLSTHNDVQVATTGKRIADNANYCRDLVNQLLGNLANPKEYVPLEFKALLQRFFSSRQSKATIRINDKIPKGAWICGHETDLISILENLIRNAEEAALPRSASIEILASATDTQLVVQVSDSGPGIPPDDTGKIFDAFHTKNKEGGTGIGLHLCRRIATDHKGELDLITNSSSGATFELRLPLVQQENSQPTTGDVGELAPLSVLCIDDDPSTLDTYEMILSLDGHQINKAETGAAGLQALRRSTFDLILCDLRLPDMSGVDFQSQLIQMAPHLVAKLIFATGDLQNDKSREFLKQLQRPYLIKPFEIEELRVAIRLVTGPNDQ